MKYRIQKKDKGYEVSADGKKIATAKSINDAHKKLKAHIAKQEG